MLSDHDGRWDVIVIGTGVGGATVGHALAQRGLRVLFCEKGKSRVPNAPTGAYPEAVLPKKMPSAERFQRFAEAGRFQESIRDVSRGKGHSFSPILGQGVGGSSALFGMVMERFFPADFDSGQYFRQVPDTTPTERWPIHYQDLAPHYEAAERLYRVRGTIDPLRPAEPRGLVGEPPPLSRAGADLFHLLREGGLHPYRLPMACEYDSGCPGCQGYLCRGNCKNDSYRICVLPAVASLGADLWDECEVVRLEANSHRVTGVVCIRGGEEHTLRAPVVVLAAGAISTPALLLRSGTAQWPDGLGNGSGMVGRNFMRHHVDLYVVFPESTHESGDHVNPKEIGVNDFYIDDGVKLGTVQSFGRLPPVPVISRMIAAEMRANVGILTPLLLPFVALAARIGAKMAARGTILTSIMEDLPYRENTIRPSDQGADYQIEYRAGPSERERVKLFRERMKRALGSRRFMLIKQAADNRLLGHVCGTCRFGEDPHQSVLGPDNRAHQLDNLYVVDSSFLPSSAGTNPSLTLAANALRVAAIIESRA